MRSDAASVIVRPMGADESRRFLEVHHESVRGLAANDYPASVIEAWAPPITEERLRRFLENRDGEIRLTGHIHGRVVGIGALVVSKAELRACYVLPSAARNGVGTAIVAEIERLARQHDVRELHLQSSVTAEPFYAALGYRVEARGELRIAEGVAMAAIMMHKGLVRTA
jgi:putative acetyltransferase